MNKKIRVGLIGTGRIGKLHAENIVGNLYEYAELKSVADVYFEGAKELAKRLNIKNAYQDYHDILSDREIDAVIICSSTNTHCQIIIDSANNVKEIFCEKPIDLSVDKIKDALNVVDKKGVKLQLGFNRRFDHNFKKIYDIVRKGDIGDVHVIKVTSRDPAPPPIDYIKVSGGIFLDMAIHDFDMLRYISGSEANEVFATGGVMIDPAIGKIGDIDTAVTIVKMKNNIICLVDNSRKSVYGYDQRLEVFGSKGCLIADNNTPTNVKHYNDLSVNSDKPYYFFLERYKNAYINELREFFESIRIDKKPLVSGIDGLKSTYIALAAKESLMKGDKIEVKEF